MPMERAWRLMRNYDHTTTNCIIGVWHLLEMAYGALCEISVMPDRHLDDPKVVNTTHYPMAHGLLFY